MGVDIDHGHVKGKTYTIANTTATVKATPGRVWGVQVFFSTAAGSVELKDGGSGGTTLWKRTFQSTTAGSGHADNYLHGLYFATDIYIAMTNNVQTCIQYT